MMFVLCSAQFFQTAGVTVRLRTTVQERNGEETMTQPGSPLPRRTLIKGAGLGLIAGAFGSLTAAAWAWLDWSRRLPEP
jgi:hypothetical protein